MLRKNTAFMARQQSEGGFGVAFGSSPAPTATPRMLECVTLLRPGNVHICRDFSGHGSGALER